MVILHDTTRKYIILWGGGGHLTLKGTLLIYKINL